MADDDKRGPPDSLSGKLYDAFDADADEGAADAEGNDTFDHDAGAGVPDAADDPTAQPPKRPTDLPF